MADREWLAVGPGGWVRYRDDDLDVPVYVRLEEEPDGRLVVADVVMTFDDSPGARRLRQVAERGARVEALANRPDTNELVRSRLDDAGPDVRAEVRSVKWPRRAGGTAAGSYGWSGEASGTTPGIEHRDLEVSRPAGRPFPDEFFAEVATAYSKAVARTSRPAVAIAQANDVPTRTVHRWVAEARKRGQLTSGRPGKAG